MLESGRDVSPETPETVAQEIPTVITKGQLSSNGHRDIRRGLHSKHSLALTAEEGSLGKAAAEDGASGIIIK
jgi:hypothetical protein